MSLLKFLRTMPRARSQARREQAGIVGAASPGVAGYVAELDAAVHDSSRFLQVFAALKSDKALLRDDIVAIATRFAFPMAKSTTRKAALERIFRQHQASETTGAKNRAMQGRSAA